MIHTDQMAALDILRRCASARGDALALRAILILDETVERVAELEHRGVRVPARVVPIRPNLRLVEARP